MPNIEEFTAGNIDIRPTETGVEATARAGVRLAGYGSQIAEAYRQAGGALGQIADTAEQYVAHREINSGAKHGADFIVNHDQSWNDFITGKDIDPNDPSRQDQINARINNPQAAKQWRDTQLEPDLQQFQQGFLTRGGQQWAADFVDKYRTHMTARTAADQSSMAGAVIQANIEKTSDALSVAVFNDPSSLKNNFDLLDHSIGGTIQSSPTLTPEVSARVSSELKQRTEQKLVQAAIQGAILKGGNWQAIANDPAFAAYVKPAENAQFARMQEQYQRSRDYDARMTARLDRQEKQDASDEATNNYRTEIVSQDPRLKNNPVAQRVVKDPDLLPSSKARLLNEIRRETLPETDARISEQSQTNLLRQLWGAKTDDDYAKFETDAHNARMKDAGEPGSLNSAHYDWLMKERENRKTPEGVAMAQDRDRFFHYYEQTIDGGMLLGTHSALGNQQMQRAYMDAMQYENQLRAKGVNPHELYNPNSQYFFGKNINAYQVTQQQALAYGLKLQGISQKGEVQGTQGNPFVVPPGMTVENWRTQFPNGGYVSVNGVTRFIPPKGK